MKILAATFLICSLSPMIAMAAQEQTPQATAPGVTISPDQPKSSRSAAQGREDANLAQKLSQTNGTIKPPSVDPGMAKAPPANARGTMPVLHPPANTQSK